ncbi:excinuclease ABC subunit UvrC [Fulvivirga sedimenti]|uniref:UvrABC system protein C n=1 Tax=Fulvivirga sedimenti TaxID=2879465 RepID=A0A9X1KYW6_9BACT|nr:excinuclease ABC subunit UvrC [Fulvivirga sedimenti]
MGSRTDSINSDSIGEPRFNVEERNKLPHQPGVYKFYNREDVMLYVGKAKDLRKRVASYFTKSHNLNRKTRKLVHETAAISFTMANSEFDALLLENNLIKTHQPKYNILLKDDKTFPYICILNERFPRIISTRKFRPSDGEYFGPFSSVVAMKSVLDLLRKLYTIRTCKLNLSEKNIEAGKFKVCLEYHIGNCLGPCEGLQSEAHYNEEIEQARNILKGNLSVVSRYFRSNMQAAAEKLEFERAQRFKEKLDLLERFQLKSTVVNPKLTDLDVLAIVSTDDVAFINYMQVVNGAIILARTLEIRKRLEESDADILAFAAMHLREEHESNNRTIITNVRFSLEEEDEIIVPKIGDKKKLVTLSLKNALEMKRERTKSAEETTAPSEVLLRMQKDLRLSEVPDHIECFDNSNLQGSNAVASMVCFRNGKPSRKEYRHFNIRTVEGPNDFASMQEIVYRRYKRVLEEESDLPKLIVVDGGKGQLSSACQALKDLDIYGRVPIIGIAKRLEELYYPEDSLPLHISKKSPSLMILQHLRDEAHRFAITFHRNKRSKNAFKTELEDIEGIGKSTADKLLKAFKSVKKIREAPMESLEQIVGTAKARVVAEHFRAGDRE